MILRRLFSLAVVLLSVGWLVPFFLAVENFLNFVDAEIDPLLMGRHPINSFPFVHFSQEALAVGFAWLAVVLLYWAWRLDSYLLRRGQNG